MRKIKAQNSYLKNQTRKNLAKAALCILIFAAALFGLAWRVLSTLQVGQLEAVWLVFSLLPLGASYFYLRKYRIYRGGWEGEKQVAQHLNRMLSDDFYLINDLYLGSGGDIDHVVLAPSGVYVLETKNWRGTVSCRGDEWQREGKHASASPSLQVKRNAAKIKRLIGNAPALRSLDVWVEGIVVLTNRHAKIHLSNPAVPVLKLEQLPSYLSRQGARRLSGEELAAIGKEIVKHKA
ncbi:MAG: NERD domain-containing protein [Candidatus Bathyarchaeota archaeon]|nr:NERD domain-containing protein [Candidatus Bathyarchaeota archaeon]